MRRLKTCKYAEPTKCKYKTKAKKYIHGKLGKEILEYEDCFISCPADAGTDGRGNNKCFECEIKEEV